MKKIFSGIVLIFFLGMLSPISVSAGTGYIGIYENIYIDTVAIINRPLGAHSPGNLEIRMKNGFSLPSGVSCDNKYITTLGNTPGFNSMLAILLTVKAKDKPVFLYITDDSNYMAHPGRCSIVAAGIK